MAATDLRAGLVPELDVADLSVSISFYTELLGFEMAFERPAERFAYLVAGGAELMVQEAAGPGRRFRTAPLEPPFGRGVNFQLAVADVDAVHERVVAGGYEPVVAMEERWYQVDVVNPGGRWTSAGPTEAGNRQFVVADPDGYLWRPFTDLGVRPTGRER
jgi:catechol 2,3-dioxygenase-like lactoylglutathione lyase family enzyme